MSELSTPFIAFIPNFDEMSSTTSKTGDVHTLLKFSFTIYIRKFLIHLPGISRIFYQVTNL